MDDKNRLDKYKHCLHFDTILYLHLPLNLQNVFNEFTFSGVWIIDGKDVFYNQFAQVTFLCPMRFERYPLDEHICKFRVGSTNMDINYMRFGETTVTYDEGSRNTILDYQVEAKQLREQDRILRYQGTNYSVTGMKLMSIFCIFSPNHRCQLASVQVPL